ncbi:GNAT family N-acetyltransferase [Flavihumibacter fluvii]|uniref:GNAT family N-acetyltransferase n=1 Tax=Flavihumibacter fluvii TaxID=2838157 RepID=UPI001BDE6E9F|nr:GNAT family N-acetyltransferase [Flavihumibacter fluvii]ULQ53213.1 GNAT family N-acetyltransferase [Flavihumibacter fluvii]
MPVIKFEIRNALKEEYSKIGQLMVRVYSQLEGFPGKNEQPGYYTMLENVGQLTSNFKTELIVAVTKEGELMGAVVYFGDMSSYGSGGIATQEKNAAGFRLLAVDPKYAGHGIGRALTMICIAKAKEAGLDRMIIHTTKAMPVAWKMYEKIGFIRDEQLDFKQGDLQVYGFLLALH